MFNFLHTFEPSAILLTLGPIHIYWYGLFIVLGIISALGVSLKLAKYYQIPTDKLFDLVFWLIIGGLVGARIYDICLELPYYLNHPLQALKIWQGGLAIHGAIIAGVIIIYIFSRRESLNFWRLFSFLVPGLAIGQAIGRWGNYFNQELFGLPTDRPWGIPINILNRPEQYLIEPYFQPTFLYESLGCLVIFLILISLNYYYIRRGALEKKCILLVALYMVLYSILRFSLEFIKVDQTPTIFNLRWPQIISLIIFLIGTILIFSLHAKKIENNQ